MPDFASFAQGLAVWTLPVLLAITMHEAAHGYAAWRLGDDTAKRLGRVTLNPLPHIDPIGTVVLPGVLLAIGSPFLFGFAKPVPVAFHRLRDPKRDMVLVAAAGPAINIVLAIVAALLFHILDLVPDVARGWLLENLRNAIVINLVLAAFNMLPVPPLDGGRILVGILPYRLAVPLARIEPYGFMIVLGAIFLLPLVGGLVGLDLDIVGGWLRWSMSELFRLVLFVTGHG